jgi:hypothetical protein
VVAGHTVQVVGSLERLAGDGESSRKGAAAGRRGVPDSRAGREAAAAAGSPAAGCRKVVPEGTSPLAAFHSRHTAVAGVLQVADLPHASHPWCRRKRRSHLASALRTVKIVSLVLIISGFSWTYPKFPRQMDRRVRTRHLVLLDLEI